VSRDKVNLGLQSTAAVPCIVCHHLLLAPDNNETHNPPHIPGLGSSWGHLVWAGQNCMLSDVQHCDLIRCLPQEAFLSCWHPSVTTERCHSQEQEAAKSKSCPLLPLTWPHHRWATPAPQGDILVCVACVWGAKVHLTNFWHEQHKLLSFVWHFQKRVPDTSPASVMMQATQIHFFIAHANSMRKTQTQCPLLAHLWWGHVGPSRHDLVTGGHSAAKEIAKTHLIVGGDVSKALRGQIWALFCCVAQNFINHCPASTILSPADAFFHPAISDTSRNTIFDRKVALGCHK